MHRFYLLSVVSLIFLTTVSTVLLSIRSPPDGIIYNGVPTTPIDCHIVIAGGSLASLSAALIAANLTVNANPSVRICYFEITDWVGGQMTSQGTSAIDFGETYAHFPIHLPALFIDLLTTGSIGGLLPNGTANVGRCTVSDKCFLPEWAVEWANAEFLKYPNLEVFLNSAVIQSTRDPVSTNITQLTILQRTPVPGTHGYERRLSDALADWYSPQDSAYFTKQLFTISNPQVVIEASEFGDVLMTANLSVAQGVEEDYENSTSYNNTCGQAATFCFWMSWGNTPAPSPDPIPAGSDDGTAFELNSWTGNYSHVLTWRRSFAIDPNANPEVPQPGDVMLINSLNDYDEGNIWLPYNLAQEQVQNNAWSGGINYTALALAELRAYGWYYYLKNLTLINNVTAYPYIYLNTSSANTTNGLSKMPYLRESRRSVRGITDFVLCHWPLAQLEVPTPGCSYPGGSKGGYMGYKWHDTIGIGQYNFDIHPLNGNVCKLPPYFNGTGAHTPAGLYYIPFRALTVAESGNLIVAGKSMSQTFWANAATRLHPEEWVTGTAAASAAVLMIQNHWKSTMDVYNNIDQLQNLLSGPVINQPLEWINPNATFVN